MSVGPDAEALVAAAKDAVHRAYAPYSGFHVGAALQLGDGSVVTGANVENASYGLSLCAETVAIAKAANEGRLGEVVAVAVAGGLKGELGDAPVTPCGRCRQLLHEAAALGGRDLPVHCAGANGYQTIMLSELLPRAFGPASLD